MSVASRGIKKRLWENCDKRCYYCRREIFYVKRKRYDPPLSHPQAFTVGHKIPLSKGGSQNIDNVGACCLECNQNKGAALIQGKYD